MAEARKLNSLIDFQRSVFILDARNERLAAMRAQFDAWNAQFGPVPEDARVSLVYSEKDMPRP